MPLISIVVPVYGIEVYLRPCLESIMGQSFRDFELIVVNDASPDRCAEIIDEYSARDSRVRPVHLDRNVGLGHARNAGFDLVTGDYVWFVDGDDWLEQGALESVAARLRATSTDVLVVDYARAQLDGSTKRNEMASVLGEAPSGVFRINEYPELLRNFAVAWNKVVRVGWLREIRVPFPTGWYEDIPWAYPLLDRAERIAVLDRVCLLYRQRRNGNILNATSPRHVELFDQYELALARLPEGVVRDHVRNSVIDHGLLVLNAPRRLPARLPFFRRLKDFVRSHGLRPRTAKQRVLLGGGWIPLPWARAVIRWRPPAGDLRRKLRRLPGLAYYWAQRRLPLQDLAVYSSYWGRAYECSPAAIEAKARELAPHVRSAWIVTADQAGRLPADIKPLVIGSLPYYGALARARWVIYNDNLEGEIVKRPGSVHVQTHHGTPIKAMGVDEPGADVGRLLKRCDRWDFDLSSSRYASEIWARAYPCGFQTLEIGSPRNDVLVNAPSSGTGMVLYAPTFRPGVAPPEIKGVNVVVKPHYFDEEQAPPQPSIERLLLAADVLITDYSSVMFDFALLDRPIVIYAPDWESYVDSRGVYFDLLANPPGPVARTLPELQAIFDRGVFKNFKDQRAAFREKFCGFESGKAAETLVRKVFPC